MRNTLILLSSLALAAAACADGSSSTVTSDLMVKLDDNPNVDLLSVVSQSYRIGADGVDLNSEDTLGGTLTATHDETTSFGGDGVNTFHAVATATSVLDSPDYSQVPRVFPDYGYDYTSEGARFYLSIINRTDVKQTITFHVTLNQSTTLHAGGPYGPGLFDNDGNPITPGGYAQGDLTSGVIDKSNDDDANAGYPNLRVPDYYTSLNGSGVAVSDYHSDGLVATFDATYILPGRQAHVYQLNSNAAAYAQFTPVPEPCALAALGVGALGLLRRRRG